MVKKVALVTGAAQGIGLEVVKKLAEKNFLVYLTARNQEKGKKSAAELEKKGLDVKFLKMDVADPGSVETAAKNFGKESAVLDVLVNNAGILLDDKHSILDEPISNYEETFRTNVEGPIVVTRLFLPYLKKSSDPRVINVSSGAGSLSNMGGYAPAYSVSKAALNAVTKQLAAALPQIAVNSVCPGWVRTKMGGSAAPRSVEEGAASVMWLVTEAPKRLTGGFYRDGKEVDW